MIVQYIVSIVANEPGIVSTLKREIVACGELAGSNFINVRVSHLHGGLSGVAVGGGGPIRASPFWGDIIL